MRWLPGFITGLPGYILSRMEMGVFRGPWQIFCSYKVVHSAFRGERGILSLPAKYVTVTSSHCTPLTRKTIGHCWISSDPANKESRGSGSNWIASKKPLRETCFAERRKACFAERRQTRDERRASPRDAGREACFAERRRARDERRKSRKTSVYRLSCFFASPDAKTRLSCFFASLNILATPVKNPASAGFLFGEL